MRNSGKVRDYGWIISVDCCHKWKLFMSKLEEKGQYKK